MTTSETRAEENLSAFLERALEQFGPNGENWTQVGNLATERPNCCTLTALWWAAGYPGSGGHPPAIVERATRFLQAHSGQYLALWNDMPGRTFPDVRAAYLWAIRDAKAIEGGAA